MTRLSWLVVVALFLVIPALNTAFQGDVNTPAVTDSVAESIQEGPIGCCA